MQPSTLTYRVTGVRPESRDTRTIFLARADGGDITYHPGQYINVFFPGSSTPAGKAYSLSTSPHEERCAITVKNIGEFSGRLCDLSEGDTFEATVPYGFFRPEFSETTLILIAGGIGITPFRSMKLHALAADPYRTIHLFHSIKKHDDRIFYNELRELAERHINMHVHYFVTQEDVCDDTHIPRRIETKDILAHAPADGGVEFLVCGSIGFTRDIWKGLRESGVSEEFIYTEAFFLH